MKGYKKNLAIYERVSYGGEKRYMGKIKSFWYPKYLKQHPVEKYYFLVDHVEGASWIGSFEECRKQLRKRYLKYLGKKRNQRRRRIRFIRKVWP